jgi:beta-lactam-binding protein with PASTA domain
MALHSVDHLVTRPGPALPAGRRGEEDPEGIGASENEARDILKKAGWTVSTRTVDNASDRGTVVGQNPSDTALPGETILLSISSGDVPSPPVAPR